MVFLYSGANKNEYERIKPKIAAADRRMVQVISLLATILIAGMFVTAMFVSGVGMNRVVYGIGTIVSLVLFIGSVVFRHNNRLVIPMVYLAYSIFYIYGIMIGAITDPSQKTVTFMVMLVFLPVLFVGRPVYSVVTTTLYITIFILLCLKTKSGKVLGNDIIDALVFGILGMISGTILSYVKVRGYLLEEKLRVANSKLRDATRLDLLTNMLNRNAYEKDLYTIARECKSSLGCTYIDVNGLKYLNDNYGHEYGDRMLKTVASFIKKHYNEDHSYRIGGDEFVVFIPDSSPYDIKHRKEAFIAEIEKKNYHAAVGWKIHHLDDLSMRDLITEAEGFMEKEKQKFYEQADFDRRKN